MLPKLRGNAEFMEYMPDSLPAGKSINRDYFMTVLYSLYPEYMMKIIDHANSQRFASANSANNMDEIKVTQKMFDELTALPFHSRKFIPLL